MKKTRLLLFTLLFTSYNFLTAQNVTVSGAVSGDGSYATLGDAFTALNGAAQPDAIITIAITGNTTESASAALNANSWKSVTISPSGGASRAISGDIATALIQLNGADHVIIDGLNTGGNSLVIENTNTNSGATIEFTNDAHNNTIQNTTVLGATSSITSGVLLFSSAGGGGTGNDSITVKSCTISASGAGTPVNGIYSSGQITSGQENSLIELNGCNIADFFSAISPTNGVLISSGNTDWLITGCRFYQSISRTYTADNVHHAIQITAGNNYKINDNAIGYASSNSTGVYTMSSAGNVTRFIGIELSVGTTVASSIQNNTVTAISLTSAATTSLAPGVLCGINIAAGNANVGTVTGNTIGGASGTDLFSLTTTTGTAGMLVGIGSVSTGTVSIQNNTLGGLTAIGNTSAQPAYVCGIAISGIAASLNISNNMIGTATANSIRAGVVSVTTAASQAAGILFTTSPTNTVISGNTIQNISAFGSASGFVRGVVTATASSSSSVYTVTSNNIHHLTCNSSLTGLVSGMSSAGGISLGLGTSCVIKGNTIHAISNTATGTGNYYVVGISHANANNTTISDNTIYDLSNTGTATSTTLPAIVSGIAIRTGAGNLVVQNNMISLGSGQTTNTAFIGIMANHGTTPDPVDKIYHNTININGTASSGAQPSFGFLRGDLSSIARTVTIEFVNNLVTNNRNGGTGKHYAIANNYGAAASSSTGWTTNASNYNVLNANTATVGWWTSDQTFAGWKSGSASDANSHSGISVTYVNSTSDLHLNMGVSPTMLESRGVVISGLTTDIDNQLRPGPTGSVNGGATAPDIGADEFDGVWLDDVAPVISYTTIVSNCANGDRMLTSQISDQSGVPTSGSLLPRIYYKKNAGSWFSSAGQLSTGTGTNGAWTFTISASDMSGLTANDVVSYFVIAQDVAASSNVVSFPSAGLAASDVLTITSYPTTPSTYTVNPSPLTSTISSQNNITCNGLSDGSASVSVSGGTGTLSYSWSINAETTSVISAVPAGNYTLSVTDQNMCSATQLVSITQPVAIVISTTPLNISCHGANDGSITASVNGGAGSFTYLWASVGSTGTSLSGLSAGSYTLVVTDANSCSQMSVTTIIDPAAITLIVTKKDISCNGLQDGTIEVSASGGTGALSYAWASIGSTTSSVSGLSAGSYTLTVTDANNCSSAISATINDPSVISLTASSKHASCFGSNSGEVSVTASGGTGNYTYLWTPSGATTAIVPNLIAGNYSVTVMDANSCSALANATISEPPVITLSTAAQHISCNGANTGAVSVTANGGAGNYSYLWTPSGATTANVPNLIAGNYSVAVTDANSCSVQTVVTVSQSTAITLSTAAQHINCNGATTGEVSVTANGGAGNYFYLWTPSGATTATVPNLAAGNYSLTVTDANSCSVQTVVTISQPAAINLSVAAKHVGCNGANTGEVSVTTTGGAGNYSYMWVPSGATTATVPNLAAGNYSVMVVDANNCSAATTVTISESPAMSLSTSKKDINCYGANSGEVSVTANGGSGNYTYLWTPSGATTATVPNLVAGTYSLTVTDANNCTQIVAVTISQPPSIGFNLVNDNVTCAGANNGKASVTANGGAGNYSYLWAPINATTSAITNLAPGTYTLTVIDFNNCSVSYPFSITQPAAIDVSVTVNGNVIASNEVSAAYQWVDCTNNYAPISGANSDTYTVTADGKYAVIVTVGNCSDTSACVDMNITGLKPANTSVPAAIYPNPNNGNFTLEVWNEGQITIYNALGEIVENKSVTQGKHTFMLTQQPSGIYYVRIQQNDQYQLLKLIKY